MTSTSSSSSTAHTKKAKEPVITPSSPASSDTVSSSTATSAATAATASSSSSSSAYLQVLKDYSLLMEYKRLKSQSPTGVYVLPSADSLRRWDGVLFLRKGHYRGSIFRFLVVIPIAYPDEPPRVIFRSEIFHPLIDASTGALDLSFQFSPWNAQQHYLVLVLGYIKKIFYKTEWWEGRIGREQFNKQAQKLWLQNPTEYLRLCESFSHKSSSSEVLYNTVLQRELGCSIQFSRPTLGHEEALRRIVGQELEKGIAGNSYLDWFVEGVWKLEEGFFNSTLLGATTMNNNQQKNKREEKKKNEVNAAMAAALATAASVSASAAAASSSSTSTAASASTASSSSSNSASSSATSAITTITTPTTQ